MLFWRSPDRSGFATRLVHGRAGAVREAQCDTSNWRTTDVRKMTSSPGSGRVQKGVVNVAKMGTAACKSRTTSTVRTGKQLVLGVGYHRCHGEEGRVDARRLKPALEASVWSENRASEYVA